MLSPKEISPVGVPASGEAIKLVSVEELPLSERSVGRLREPREFGRTPQPIKDLITKADAGDAEAQHNLSLLYINGECGSIKKDLAKAFKYMNLSANQGNPKALNNLGAVFLTEYELYGIKKDVPKAFHYFSQALLKGGGKNSYFNLGALFAKESPATSQSMGLSLNFFYMAHQMGCLDSAEHFMLMYNYFMSGFKLKGMHKAAKDWGGTISIPSAVEVDFVKLCLDVSASTDGNTIVKAFYTLQAIATSVRLALSTGGVVTTSSLGVRSEGEKLPFKSHHAAGGAGVPSGPGAALKKT